MHVDCHMQGVGVVVTCVRLCQTLWGMEKGVLLVPLRLQTRPTAYAIAPHLHS